jgi:hypothetical protein
MIPRSMTNTEYEIAPINVGVVLFLCYMGTILILVAAQR